LALLLVSPQVRADAEEGFVSMFNGKDLTGWEGETEFWSVRDGAITGESTPEKPCDHQSFLIWRGGEPADFDLRLSYRLPTGNSGIQFRSQPRSVRDVAGYQADMAVGSDWTGAIYEVDGRAGFVLRGQQCVADKDGKKTVTPLGDPKELQKVVKDGDWNDYEIIARGPEITIKINGVVMSKLTDLDAKRAARRGAIAFQLHPGPPMTVQFKNIRIKEFK
jgi:hypothetical protein